MHADQAAPAVVPALAGARSWVTWHWASAQQTALLMVGAFGPLIAALLLSIRDGGGRAAARLLLQALRYRFPLRALLVALRLCPALAALAVYLRSLEGGPTLTWSVSPPSFVLVYLLLFFLGGSFQEEFGWAYAIDSTQRR